MRLAAGLFSEPGKVRGALTAGEPHRRFREPGRDEARRRSREHLIRRFLWMLPAAVYGGLSEPATVTGETLRVSMLADRFEFGASATDRTRRSRSRMPSAAAGAGSGRLQRRFGVLPQEVRDRAPRG